MSANPAILLLMLIASQHAASEPGKTMDVTIFVKPAILNGGGTVVVLPKAVVASGTTGASTNVEVDDDFSIVEFDFPKDQGWTLHFRASVYGEPSSRPLRTKRISVGTSTYSDEHGRTIRDAPVDIYHVYGSKLSEKQTYARGTFFDRFIEKGLICKSYASARVCVPTNKNLDVSVH